MTNKSKVNPRRYAKREIRPCVGVGGMARKVMPRSCKGKGWTSHASMQAETLESGSSASTRPVCA